MQQNLPFNFNEVFKLTNLGLNPELFKFGQVTFESQKYICIKDAAVSIIIFHVSLTIFCRIVPSSTRQKISLWRESQ